jgi:hypothetical protein
MPKETDRLKLPLPLGNETVSRESINGIFEKIDAGVATQADLETLREAVKGAVDGAIPRLIPDTRGVATKPSDYRKNVAYSFKSGSTIGLPAELFVVLQGLKGWNDDSGGVTHEYASGGTTGGMYHRTGTTANDTWGPWMQIVDQAVPWQKRKLTEDNGLSINVSNGNANNLVAAGFYVGENIANAPTTASGAWWYIEVQAMASNSWVIQKAYDLFSSGSFRMRIKSNGTWTAWSQDLFQSVSNGKASIAAAITGKGVAASGSDTFDSLTTKISQISSDFKTLGGNTNIAVSNEQGYSGKEVTSTVLDFIPKIVTLNLETSYRNSNSYDSGSFKAGTSLKFDSKTNTFPPSWISSEGLWGGSGAKFYFYISVGWNITSRTLRITITDEMGSSTKNIAVSWSVYGL